MRLFRFSTIGIALTLLVSPVIGTTTAQAVGTDGSLDASFDPGTGLTYQGSVLPAIAMGMGVQSDGKIVLGGRFSAYNGTPRYNLARVNSNGSVDTSFVTDTTENSTNEPINALAVQSTGKIIIGGQFTTYKGVDRGRLAQLNQDASLNLPYPVGPDPYVPVLGFNQEVWNIREVPSGGLFAMGFFSHYGQVARGGLAKLNADGSLDETFVPRDGIYGTGSVHDLVLNNNGTLIMGGSFTSYDSVEPVRHMWDPVGWFFGAPNMGVKEQFPTPETTIFSHSLHSCSMVA